MVHVLILLEISPKLLLHDEDVLEYETIVPLATRMAWDTKVHIATLTDVACPAAAPVAVVWASLVEQLVEAGNTPCRLSAHRFAAGEAGVFLLFGAAGWALAVLARRRKPTPTGRAHLHASIFPVGRHAGVTRPSRGARELASRVCRPAPSTVSLCQSVRQTGGLARRLDHRRARLAGPSAAWRAGWRLVRSRLEVRRAWWARSLLRPWEISLLRVSGQASGHSGTALRWRTGPDRSDRDAGGVWPGHR